MTTDPLPTTRPHALAVAEPVWRMLVTALGEPHERAGILTARETSTPAGTVWHARTLTWAPDDTYLYRDSTGLALRSHGWVPAVRHAAANAHMAIFVHTHPGGRAMFSSADDDVDRSLAAAYPNLGVTGAYLSLVVAGTPEHPTATARTLPSSGFRTVPKIRVVGDRLRLISDGGSSHDTNGTASELFDRQIRAFGAGGQRQLGQLHIGVVGAGGTGSAVSEQLTRLGVGRLTLIDDDHVTSATPSRTYGTTTSHIGQPKVDVVAASLRHIGSGTDITPLQANMASRDALHALSSADAIFSCVDGHGGRLILNRYAYAHLVPVIDTAVLVQAEPGRTVEAVGRVTWLAPGTACLLCRGRLDPVAAYEELLTPTERQRLAGQGYVRQAASPQPAVVTLTTLIAALATTELLNRLFDLTDRTPSELIARIGHREIRSNTTSPRPGCFCSDPGFLGRGDQAPHLDLLLPQ